MSTDTTPLPDGTDRDQLTDREREALENLAEAYADSPFGEVFEGMLQSAEPEPTEETTS